MNENITGFDFSPLSANPKVEDFSPEEITAHGFDYPNPRTTSRLKKIGIVAGVVFLVSITLAAVALAGGFYALIAPFVVLLSFSPLLAVGLVVFYLINWSRFPRKSNLRWILFAKLNSLAYHNPKTTSSKLENLDTSKRIESLRSYLLDFHLDGVFFNRGVNSFDNFVDLTDRTTCFEHVKTISKGDNDTESFYFNVIRFDFGRPVPNILLDGLGNINPMEGEKYEAQKLSLEGDFDKHFKMFVPTDYHLDALQILTPDVMADLVDFGFRYDIELIDQYAYISAMHKNEHGDYGAFVKEFFTNAQEIIKELHEQVDAYTDRHEASEGRAKLKRKLW